MKNFKEISSRFVVSPVVLLSRILVIISTISLTVMMMLTVSDVFLRYLVKSPIPDSQQMTEYLMICVAFLAMAWVAVKNEHITVDLIVPRFPLRVQEIFDSVTYLLGLGMVVLISWRTFLEAPTVKEIGFDTLILEIPQYPFFIILGFGLAALALVMIIQVVQHIYKAVKG